MDKQGMLGNPAVVEEVVEEPPSKVVRPVVDHPSMGKDGESLMMSTRLASVEKADADAAYAAAWKEHGGTCPCGNHAGSAHYSVCRLWFGEVQRKLYELFPDKG